MSRAKLLDNGNLLIPVRAESENGIIGDSLKEVEPDSKEFKDWLPFLSDEDKAKLGTN